MKNGQGIKDMQFTRASQYYPETLSFPEINEKKEQDFSPLDFSQFQQDFSYLEHNPNSDFFQKTSAEAEKDFTNFENENNINTALQNDAQNENSQFFDKKSIKNSKKTPNFENMLRILQNSKPDEILAKALSSNNFGFQNPVASQLISNLLSSKKSPTPRASKQENSHKTKATDFYEEL